MAVGTKKKSTTARRPSGPAKEPARKKARSSGQGKVDAHEVKSASGGTGKRSKADGLDSAGARRPKADKPRAAAGSAGRKPSDAPKPRAKKRAAAGSNGHANGRHVRRRVEARDGQPRAESTAMIERAGPEVRERIRQGLFQALDGFVRSRQLGRVSLQGRFDWGDIEAPGLEPELAFVSYDRFASYRNVPASLTWHVVPDLVVEIVGDAEEITPVSQWLEAYFQAGVRRVWVVDPGQLKIHDHDSVSSSRVIGRDQTIDGADLLPGFELPLKDLEAPGQG